VSNTLQQYNETDRLKKVIIGRYQGYRAAEEYVELVNKDQKKGLPAEKDLALEFQVFRKALEEEGVEVLEPDYVGKFVYDQLTPRDIAVTIGRKIVLSNMVKASRRYEAAGIFHHILAMEGEKPCILIPPDSRMLLEGGDIIVDKGHIFVGLSQRTNQAGLDYLREQFGDQFTLVPVYCRSLKEGENVLHLDCAFNPVGEKHALIYPDGFNAIPPFIEKGYEWIEVNAEEQAALATNVLSINPRTVISRDNPICKRVNAAMRKIGLRVIELPFDAAPRTGGSLRCCSLPLTRESQA
jgi:N-dimethylarginine dimethylaminohydrolase